jgi:hypothetical protein
MKMIGIDQGLFRTIVRYILVVGVTEVPWYAHHSMYEDFKM